MIYAVVAMIALVAALDFLQALSGNLQALFRGGLTALLAYQVFLGRPWARVVIVVLAALTALLVIPAVIALMRVAPGLAIVTGLLFCAFLGGSIALFLDPAKHHFEGRN